jgi:membrane protease subunit HflC
MRSLTAVLMLAVLAALATFGSALVVDTTQYAVVTRFGRPVRTYTTPGLGFRVPLVDQVVWLDARLLTTEPPTA